MSSEKRRTLVTGSVSTIDAIIRSLNKEGGSAMASVQTIIHQDNQSFIQQKMQGKRRTY